MIYSNFYKKRVATCMRCKLALINFDTSGGNDSLTVASEQQFYDYKILRKYFIIDHDIYRVRSNCGKCINKACSAYMKNQ